MKVGKIRIPHFFVAIFVVKDKARKVLFVCTNIEKKCTQHRKHFQQGVKNAASMLTIEGIIKINENILFFVFIILSVLCTYLEIRIISHILVNKQLK